MEHNKFKDNKIKDCVGEVIRVRAAGSWDVSGNVVENHKDGLAVELGLGDSAQEVAELVAQLRVTLQDLGDNHRALALSVEAALNARDRTALQQAGDWAAQIGVPVVSQAIFEILKKLAGG